MKKITIFSMMLLMVSSIFVGCLKKDNDLTFVISNALMGQSIYYEVKGEEIGEKKGTLIFREKINIGKVSKTNNSFNISELKIYTDSNKTKLLFSYDSTTDNSYDYFGIPIDSDEVYFHLTEDILIK